MADSLISEIKLEAGNARPWLYFDSDFYLAQCVHSGVTPQIGSPESYLEHYLQKGARAGFSPNPFFDEEYYRARYPAVAKAITKFRWSCGLEHYLSVGSSSNYSPAWFFDGAFYQTNNPDLTNENLRKGEFADPYSHYLRAGLNESRIGHWTIQALKLKSAFEYPKNRHELKAFISNGVKISETFKPVFDYDWMREKYGWGHTIRPEFFIRYYILNVKSAKLSPSPYFDEAYYLSVLPEVQQAVETDTLLCGYEHFIMHGMQENRRPAKNFDPQYYRAKNMAPAANWSENSVSESFFAHFLRNHAERKLEVFPPLSRGDIPEDMGKGLYEWRCQLNAALLSEIDLGQAQAPDVSIILIGRNNFEQTANCIVTAACNTKASIEVIVFDNGSADDTKNIPRLNPQIKYLRADKNIGFTLAANQAAKLATGRALVLLNNDAEVAPRAIDLALKRLESDRSIGAVGAKIIRMHGRLQEAGSIVWEDGGCLGYARDASPHDGQVNFVHDVDFCSGAFLAIMRQDWDELGGFDEGFAPAYYEETDLCLRIWERGQRVVYDPKVVVWHFEFGSSAFQEEALAQMRKNQRYFISRHRQFLSKCLPSNAAYVERARLRHVKGKRILFVEDRIPDPSKGMGFVRSASLVKTLADSSGLLSVLGLHNHEWPAATELTSGDLPIEILTNFNVNNMGSLLRNRTGLYDVLWLSRTHNLPRIKEWRKANPDFFANLRVVLDTEAISAMRRFAYAKQVGQFASLPDMVKEEFEQLENVDHICVVNELDRQLLQDALKQMGVSIPVSVLGHSLHVQPHLPQFDDTTEIVLFGAYSQPDSPNVDAVLWFDRTVRPLIHDLPGLRFAIAGSDAALFANASNLLHDYRIINDPPRLAEVYQNARLMVAPTRFAAGIPMKVHEAASYGVPVIMTELLADQLGWRQYGAGENVAAPETMAYAIENLAMDREAWRQCQALQSRLVARDCDPAAFNASIQNVIG